MKRFDNKLKNKIAEYRKNKIDISDLIKDYSIQGEDLSLCIIKSMDRNHEDISNVNFSGAVLGETGKKFKMVRCNLSNCNFKNAKCDGIFIIRYSNCTNCNFSESFFPFMEYQHTDFRRCNLCGLVMPFGSLNGHGALFDHDTICKKWGVNFDQNSTTLNYTCKI